MNPEKFFSFVPENFASIFKKSADLRRKLFMQDGDPSQNSVKSRSARDEVDTQKFTIPARTPYLNPIENIHFGNQRRRQDTFDQQITREDFAVFPARVMTTLELIPTDVVDKTNCFMGKRTNEIVKVKDRGLNTSFVFTCKCFQY